MVRINDVRSDEEVIAFIQQANKTMEDFDIHDRVNYATTSSEVLVTSAEKSITLDLTIDTSFAHVIEYFEIFLDRMTMVRQAAEFLECEFHLVINNAQFS